MERNKDKSKESTSENSEGQVPLNPELTELKRQIFTGFEKLLTPIKQEIKEFKDGQKHCLNVMSLPTNLK